MESKEFYLPHRHLRIATRDSPLALAQTKVCVELLQAQFPTMSIQVVTSRTIGDRLIDKSMSDFGETGIFVKELRSLLLEDKADIAVHSYKDVPVQQDGFVALSVLPRGSAKDILIVSPRKVLIEGGDDFLQALPKNLVVGTCSPRRNLQILQKRSDFQIIPIRGNIQTRLLKLSQKTCDAILLAEVALHRLGILSNSDNIIAFSPQDMVPAAGQGAIVVECLAKRAEELTFVQQITHQPTCFLTTIERTFLKEFEVGCTQPFGIYARNAGNDVVEIFFFFGLNPDVFHREVFVVRSEDVEKSLSLHIERIKTICKQKGICNTR